jgi:hypothetical protein
MSTTVSDACSNSFSSCLMQPDKEFLCHGNGSPDEILSICLAQENRRMYPVNHSDKLSKNKMPGSVRQWTLVPLVKKTSLHFTVWRQLTGWREQVTTWRDLRGLLYSHSDIVYLLIQSNCIGLQPSINILIMLYCIYQSTRNSTTSSYITIPTKWALYYWIKTVTKIGWFVELRVDW